MPWRASAPSERRSEALAGYGMIAAGLVLFIFALLGYRHAKRAATSAPAKFATPKKELAGLSV